MKKKSAEKRSKIFLVRFTETEWKEVQKMSKSQKAATVSEFARDRMLGSK